MVKLNKKTIKPYLAEILFLTCIFMAFYNIYEITEYREDFALELKEELQNLDSNNFNIDNEEPQITVKENNILYYSYYPDWYNLSWNVINIILYLFVGGLIYARHN